MEISGGGGAKSAERKLFRGREDVRGALRCAAAATSDGVDKFMALFMPSEANFHSCDCALRFSPQEGDFNNAVVM